MIIYLVGISCVGKTTIGKILADQINFMFFDLDAEIEKFYQKPIERIQDECLSMQGFREKASVVLDMLLNQEGNLVIAGTPSGLKYSYLKVYKKHKKRTDLISIHLIDRPENVFDRIRFYDKDSQPIDVHIDDVKKKKYIKEITGDCNYFKNSLELADIQLNIENVVLEEIPILIINRLKEIRDC